MSRFSIFYFFAHTSEKEIICDSGCIKRNGSNYHCSVRLIQSSLFWQYGALSKDEIRIITKRITKLIESNFPHYASKVFIKTSTGYYGGYGATLKDVKVIKSVSGNLKIKASGGISNIKDALAMIEAGADRIGTSKAEDIFLQNSKQVK